jgi:protein O-GlcNAc transferase
MLDAAIAAYRRALELQPERAWVHSNLVYTLLFHPDSDRRKVYEEQCRWNRQFAEPLKQFILPHANNRDLKRPLRIGYVSPDFWDQVVGRNLVPLFRCHDRRSFEVLCYSGVIRPDKLTDEFRRHALQWRSTVGIGDEELAEMIRQDGVDILVHLTQHMAGNRLPMFARKPAPVQVSFAGYPESAGLEAIELFRHPKVTVRLSNAGQRADLRLHATRIVTPEAVDQAHALVSRGIGIRGASFQMPVADAILFCKINERVLGLWARLLGEVTESRLVLLSAIGSHRQRTLEILLTNGVHARRVEFVESRPRREYLERYRRLDIVLDTFPYNGHTTSLDALWMGVPVVSLAGKTPVSRAGLSQMTNMGLPELVAHSESEYVSIAGSLARDLPRLARLRATLRVRMQASPLMDAPRFARNVEATYRSLWERWSIADAC